MTTVTRSDRGARERRGAIVDCWIVVGCVACLVATLPPATAVVPRRASQGLDSLQVGIATPSFVVDANVPFTLTAQVGGGVPPMTYFWSSATFGSTNGSSWQLELPLGAVANVSLVAVDESGRYGRANASLEAVAPPTISVSATGGRVTAGIPFPVNFSVADGVPPYNLSWSVNNASPTGSAWLTAAGTIAEPVTAVASGPAWVEASVVDAAHGEVSGTTLAGSAAFRPTVTGFEVPTELEAGRSIGLSAVLVGGAPPVEWSFLAPGDSEVAGADGSVTPPAKISWPASFATPGNRTGVLALDDAYGISVDVAATLHVVPSIVVALSATPSNSSRLLDVAAVVSGGVGPYQLNFSLSDGEASNELVSTAGTFNWTPDPLAVGDGLVRVAVQDSLGGVASATATVEYVVTAHAGGNPALDSVYSWTLVLASTAGFAFGGTAVSLILRRWDPSETLPEVIWRGFASFRRRFQHTRPHARRNRRLDR